MTGDSQASRPAVPTDPMDALRIVREQFRAAADSGAVALLDGVLSALGEAAPGWGGPAIDLIDEHAIGVSDAGGTPVGTVSRYGEQWYPDSAVRARLAGDVMPLLHRATRREAADVVARAWVAGAPGGA